MTEQDKLVAMVCTKCREAIRAEAIKEVANYIEKDSLQWTVGYHHYTNDRLENLLEALNSGKLPE